VTETLESKLEIAVHSAPDLAEDSYAPRWIEALESLGAKVRVLDFRAPDIIDRLRGVDGAMWHFFHSARERQSAPMILNAIESGLGIPVFPNLASRWHYDEKIAQHYLFESIGAPAVKTWLFWDREAAFRFIENCRYPVVFKLSLGAGASNVLKLESRDEARDLVSRMFDRGVQASSFESPRRRGLPRSVRELRAWLRRAIEGARYVIGGALPPVAGNHHIQKHYVYLQEFLPDNSCDIRIAVIGNRAFGYRRHNRPGDFRASGSGLIDWDPAQIPERALQIAHSISRDRGFQSMAYDFLFDAEGDLRVSEISYCYVNHLVFECPGHWDEDLVWHPGQIWPERAQVEDFLREVLGKRGS
jgi:hypothetical protein